MVRPAPTQDYYEVLEVKSSATHDEIKASYRRLALLYHPDKNNGSKESTEKIKMINTAWEVLRDAITRKEYDATYHKSFTAERAKAKQEADEAAKKKKAGDDAKRQADEAAQRKAQEESCKVQAEESKRAAYRAKRDVWLTWETRQEQRIRQSRKRAKELGAEVAALSIALEASKARLANDEPYWWNVLASWKKRLSEDEKNQIRRDIMDRRAAVRIKEGPFIKEEAFLQMLKDELDKRREEEKDIERKEQLRREKYEREKVEAEIERQREQMAKEAEARRKTEEERNRKEREQWEKQEKQRREQAAREAEARRKAEEERNRKWKEEWEEQQRKNRENAARHSEEARQYREELQREQTAQAERLRRYTEPHEQYGCNHKMWWEQIGGANGGCERCPRTTARQYLLRCPGCKFVACHDCMYDLKKVPLNRRSKKKAT